MSTGDYPRESDDLHMDAEAQAFFDNLVAAIATRRANGETREGIIVWMQDDLDFTREDAVPIVDYVELALKAEHRAAGRSDIIQGFLWAGIGGGITGLTYAIADPGGVFLVLWGAIAWGVIKVFMGVIKLIE